VQLELVCGAGHHVAGPREVLAVAQPRAVGDAASSCCCP
jgi:hypothetical protein